MKLLGNVRLFCAISQCHKLACPLLFRSKVVPSVDRLSVRNIHSSKRRSAKPKLAKGMAMANPRSVLGDLKPQNFDYFLVLDFEATCQENVQIKPQEIIEFPVLMINAKTLQMDDKFHQYVQPRVHTQLTGFCTQLTGIIQDMVDGQPYLEDTLKSFDKWMSDKGLLNPDVNSLFVTCGDWDLNRMLPTQCDYFNIPVPEYFNQWLNIKKAFAEVTSTYPRGMMPMLNQLNIQHQGRHHSGVDDCMNIANILRELLRRGYKANVSRSRR